MKAFVWVPRFPVCAHHRGMEEEELATEVALPRAQDYTTSVRVDAPLLRFIVGKGGKTKVKIEKDTATQLFVPSPRQARNGSCLVVKGPSQEKVDEAIGHIQYVLQEATESPSLEYSHFISLPLAIHPALIEKVGMFHDSVMDLATALDNNDTKEPSTNDEKAGKSLKESLANKNHTKESLKDNDKARESGSVVAEKHEDMNVEIAASLPVADGQVAEVAQVDPDTPLEDGTDLDKEDALDCDGQEGIEESKDCSDDECMEESKDAAGLTCSLKTNHGIEESIFINRATLHLTVLMLKLWNKERIAAAVDVLQSMKSRLMEALDNQPVAVRLRGIECMKGSPAKAHVLYARVEDADQQNRLLNTCKVIRDAFMEAGLVSDKDKKQELKLHATLMNTIQRRRKRGKRFGRRLPFDARSILAKHKDDDWGEHTLMEVHLSERFAFDENGYYHCCSSIQLPSALPSVLQSS